MGDNIRPRVLFLATWYPSEASPTNGTFVREHARAASRYADVRVLHIRGVHDRGARPLLQEEHDDALAMGLPTYRLSYPRPLPKTGYLSFLASLFWSYRRIIRSGFQPDVIHANVLDTAVPAVLLGMRHHVPVVISEHYTGFPMRSLSRFQVMQARWAFPRTERVFPVSAYLRDSIMSYGIRGRFEILPNAVDTLLFHPRTDKDEADLTRLLFVGQLQDDRKGLGVLLEALAELRKTREDWSLTVIGDGRQRERFESQASRLCLSDLVEFTGNLDHSKVADRMRHSDLFVHPSRMETQGCVLLEALASGLPVLASSAGAIPEVIGVETGWLVPHGDVPLLAKKLGEVLADQSRPDPEVSVRTAQRFSAESVGRQLLAVYAEVMCGPAT